MLCFLFVNSDRSSLRLGAHLDIHSMPVVSFPSTFAFLTISSKQPTSEILFRGNQVEEGPRAVYLHSIMVAKAYKEH